MKYFTIEELTRSTTAQLRNIDNTPSPQVISNLTALVDNILDPLREAWGKPIRVNSGYRCPKLNSAVGGSATSEHRYGMAADIKYVHDGGSMMRIINRDSFLSKTGAGNPDLSDDDIIRAVTGCEPMAGFPPQVAYMNVNDMF